MYKDAHTVENFLSGDGAVVAVVLAGPFSMLTFQTLFFFLVAFNTQGHRQ